MLEDDELKPPNIKKLDVSLDPSKSDERIEKVQEAIKVFRDLYDNFEMSKAYPSMFNLLWYSQLPCNDVLGITSSFKDELSFIKRCYWKKTPISCNAIFQKRPTDSGMCCSFNIKKAELVLKESKYTSTIATRQKYDLENGFKSGQKPDWYVANKEPETKPGIKHGLTLVFDSHSDKISSGSVLDSFRGVTVLVDGKEKFPMVQRIGVKARPGLENSISIDAIDVNALDEIRRHDPHTRNCYFPDEYELDMHQNYSQPSCIFECEIKFAAKCISTCNQFNETCDCKDKDRINNLDLKEVKSCVPWYYPIKDDEYVEMCDPWMTKKFRNILDTKIPTDQCNYCLEDCSTTKYKSSISYTELQQCDDSNIGSVFCDLTKGEMNPAPWTSDAQHEYLALNLSVPWFLETKGSQRFSDQRSRYLEQKSAQGVIFADKLKTNPYYNAFEKDIGFLNVFFSEEKVTRYIKANKGTNFDFISQLGGSLGGFMGISILSLVEIFYWVVFRFFGKVF